MGRKLTPAFSELQTEVTYQHYTLHITVVMVMVPRVVALMGSHLGDGVVIYVNWQTRLDFNCPKNMFATQNVC